MLLTSSGQEWQVILALTYSDKECNFTLLLTSSGQEWQFHIAIDLADKHTLADGPPLIDHKCLDYHYTKHGRQTYFWPMDPSSESRIDALNTTTPTLANEPTLADGPPN